MFLFFYVSLIMYSLPLDKVQDYILCFLNYFVFAPYLSGFFYWIFAEIFFGILLVDSSGVFCFVLFLRQSFAVVTQAGVQWHHLGSP